MDGAHELTPKLGALTVSNRQGCPCCAEPSGRVPPVVTSILDGATLRRCTRCGSRYTAEPPCRAVLTCRSCCLPFIAEEGRDDSACPDCRSDASFQDPTDPAIVAATEAEICESLALCLKLVGTPALTDYLDRLARRVAAQSGVSPDAARVVLFDDSAFRTFALPSGAIGMSVGMLAALEDEAELIFVLAHELAHVASGDTGAALVRLGLYAVATDTEAPRGEAWAYAVADLTALGFGRENEARADDSAVNVLLALGYDPRSALSFVTRVGEWIGAGDPRAKELAASHPPPSERYRRVQEAARSVSAPGGALRVNREVFRRAVSQRRLTEELVALAGFDAPGSPATSLPARSSRRTRLLWTSLGILLLASLFLLVGVLLAR